MVVRPRTGSTRRYREAEEIHHCPEMENRCQNAGARSLSRPTTLYPYRQGGWTPLEIFALFVKNAMTLCTAKPGADRLKKAHRLPVLHLLGVPACPSMSGGLGVAGGETATGSR